MFKKQLPLLVAVFMFFLCSIGFTEEKIAEEPVKEVTSKQIVIKGKIGEIAEDGSYVVVGEKKIVTTKELLADALFKTGDEIEITAEETKNGLTAVNYNHILNEKTEKSEASASEPVKSGASGQEKVESSVTDAPKSTESKESESLDAGEPVVPQAPENSKQSEW